MRGAGRGTGPFYCPAAKSVYLNPDFFDALAREYGFAGPFAAGYVTAHEVATDADVVDILRSAAVVGDDYQRNKAGADLAPETWTHGSSEQRVHWLSVGKRSGSPADCDTFSGEH